MTAALGTACNYDELQPILRARADALKISREELDRITGLPKGFCAKVLADPPLRRLGPDTIGPMLWGLAAKFIVVEDQRSLEMFTAGADKRDERYALNAVQHTGTVMFKFSLKKFKRLQRKGGRNSRKYMSAKKASRLGRKAVMARERKRRERARARRASAALKALSTTAPDIPLLPALGRVPPGWSSS